MPDGTAAVFGQVMAHIRAEQGLSMRALAKLAHVHPSNVSRAERGLALPTPAVARALDQALHAGGVLEVLRNGATQLATPFLPLTEIPGILEMSAHPPQPLAVGDANEDVVTVPIHAAGRVVHVQMSRRSLLQVLAVTGAALVPAAPAAAAVWPHDEDPVTFATRFLVGHQDAHHLFAPHVHIAALAQRLEGIEQIRQAVDASTRRRLRAVQGAYAEHLSWLHKESGDLNGCVAWAERAALWALDAGDHPMVTYMQLRRASLALDRRDHRAAVDLAEQAVAPSWQIPGVLAGIGHAYLARGRALAGDAPAANLEQAAALLTTKPDAETPGYLRFYGRAFSDAETATCFLEAGRPGAAIELLTRCISGIEATHRRDKASYMARLAHAHAADQAPDAAAATASEALAIATEAGSASVRAELVRLDAMLMSRWPDQPHARGFHDLISAA